METVGVLGKGEIGKAIFRVANEAGFKTFVRELKYDEMGGHPIDFLHVNIPEGKKNVDFINVVVDTIKETKPKLTIINSSVTPGTTRKIFEKIAVPIVHSPVIGVHPHLYESVKFYFPKIIGPIDKTSLDLAKKHFRALGLRIMIYKSAEESEIAKLLDLIYYAWNIVFCKWVNEICKKLYLNFEDVYTNHNNIYNSGYLKLRPNAVRPVLIPTKGPIGGHCTIPDVILFHEFFKNRFTEFILKENEKYKKEYEKF